MAAMTGTMTEEVLSNEQNSTRHLENIQRRPMKAVLSSAVERTTPELRCIDFLCFLGFHTH